jgi:hypothetical protein
MRNPSLLSARCPVIAVLESGLDPSAALPRGTRVIAARSFVGAHPMNDPIGSGTACVEAVADALTGAWGPDGEAEVLLIVAQVTSSDGITTQESLLAALEWARTIAPIDAVALTWGAADPKVERGVARRLGRLGVRFLTPADLEEELGGGTQLRPRDVEAPPAASLEAGAYSSFDTVMPPTTSRRWFSRVRASITSSASSTPARASRRRTRVA